MNHEVIECPLCGEKMTEEEGLYWCDVCGINNDSKSFCQAVAEREREEEEHRKFVEGKI